MQFAKTLLPAPEVTETNIPGSFYVAGDPSEPELRVIQFNFSHQPETTVFYVIQSPGEFDVTELRSVVALVGH